jgi:hypothetical protein
MAGVAVVVGDVHHERDAHLTEVVEAGGLLGFALRLRKRREQHARQDGNDRNDHEQFDERERGRWRDGTASGSVREGAGRVHGGMSWGLRVQDASHVPPGPWVGKD